MERKHNILTVGFKPQSRAELETGTYAVSAVVGNVCGGERWQTRETGTRGEAGEVGRLPARTGCCPGLVQIWSVGVKS